MDTQSNTPRGAPMSGVGAGQGGAALQVAHQAVVRVGELASEVAEAEAVMEALQAAVAAQTELVAQLGRMLLSPQEWASLQRRLHRSNVRAL